MVLSDSLKSLLLGALGTPEARDELLALLAGDEAKINQLIASHQGLLDKLDLDDGVADEDFGDAVGPEAAPEPL